MPGSHAINSLTRDPIVMEGTLHKAPKVRISSYSFTVKSRASLFRKVRNWSSNLGQCSTVSVAF
jgi:hypothetical protein